MQQKRFLHHKTVFQYFTLLHIKITIFIFVHYYQHQQFSYVYQLTFQRFYVPTKQYTITNQINKLKSKQTTKSLLKKKNETLP